jgi:hypothetical protein
VRELEKAAGDYCTPLRMGDGISPEAEGRLHGALVRLREDLDDDTIVKRALATLLAELVVAANASCASRPRARASTRF